ncbi:hypothetical protein AVEN_94459-1 [Araneus ventricosus]|uniref:Uncharacterized protein n=1 Tax=Araneus ventricosus TaxID=182803 RepID=A0A4Y2G153_ARAVE|nr:hypothetical protein AVEN_94459-1 [Araneus ventricosus]
MSDFVCSLVPVCTGYHPNGFVFECLKFIKVGFGSAVPDWACIGDNWSKGFFFCQAKEARWPGGLVVRIPSSKPDSTEDPPYLFHVKSYIGVKHPPAGEVRKFGVAVPAQVSSSSSDLVQNYEVRSVSKPDVNLTKPVKQETQQGERYFRSRR